MYRYCCQRCPSGRLKVRSLSCRHGGWRRFSRRAADYERVNNRPLHGPESALLYQRRRWRSTQQDSTYLRTMPSRCATCMCQRPCRALELEECSS